MWTDISGRTGRGVVALSGRAGRDSSLGNGGRVGLNSGGEGCEKGLLRRVGSLGLGQTRGMMGRWGLSGRGTTGLIPTTELADDELDWGECGHDCVDDTDLVACSALITLILSCDRSESSDKVTSDSSSSARDNSLSVSASDTSILYSSSVTGPRASTPPLEACPLKCFSQRSGPKTGGELPPLATRAEPPEELVEVLKLVAVYWRLFSSLLESFCSVEKG